MLQYMRLFGVKKKTLSAHYNTYTGAHYITNAGHHEKSLCSDNDLHQRKIKTITQIRSCYYASHKI